MGKHLDKFINDQIKDKFEEVSDEETKKEVKEYTFQKMKNEIIEDVREEITPKLTKDLQEKIRLDFKTKQSKKMIKEIRSLLLIGVVISFLVGICVNQITKILNNSNPIIIFLGCFLLIVIIFFCRVNKLVSEMIEE
ncbi:MAG: magnesium transporter [Fusobacterium sp.]|uniref:magnesium transporter n=1 Tax=Fusobacterium sp. TaxID=68766 RepID=UPI003F9FF2F0